MPVISTLRRLRQNDLEFKATLRYIVRPCLKEKCIAQVRKITSKKTAAIYKMTDSARSRLKP
jgi:hypothetical protein